MSTSSEAGRNPGGPFLFSKGAQAETRPYQNGDTERTLPAGRRSGACRVFGYASLPQPDEGRPKADLQWQSETIGSACAQRGLSLVDMVYDREPRRGRALERPGLGYALARISAGDADGLVVAEMSRLTRSVPELGRVLEWFSQSGARLIAAESELDTDEQGGRLAMRMLIELSRSERQRLVARTRKGMQEAHRKGPPGVADNPQLRDRMVRMRAQGMTLQAIADTLNAEGVPTVRGGAKWRPSSVQAATGYRRPAARETSDSRPWASRDGSGRVAV